MNSTTKKLLFIANWKSHKTSSETHHFLKELQASLSQINTKNKDILICSSYTSLESCKRYIREFSLPFFVGAQDVSEFGEGPYTGEVSGVQIREFADYVIIGHSERKRYLHETDEQIQKKIKQALTADLKVILCVQDENSQVFQGVSYVAYEPPSAISTFGVGKPDDPEHVSKVLQALAQKTDVPLLYGGSVDETTIQGYLNVDSVRGFLVGGASLKPQSFISLLSSC